MAYNHLTKTVDLKLIYLCYCEDGKICPACQIFASLTTWSGALGVRKVYHAIDTLDPITLEIVKT